MSPVQGATNPVQTRGRHFQRIKFDPGSFFFGGLTGLATLIILALLAIILANIIYRGWSGFSWGFITRGTEKDMFDVNNAGVFSRDHGQSFDVASEHRWKAATCPMSSASFAQGQTGTIAAWETAEQVYFLTVDSKSLQTTFPTAPDGMARRKHPSVAANRSGDLLLAWTEGTGWQKGGSLAWQVFDAKGKPTVEKGRVPGVPAWGLVAAVANADGTFKIIY